MAPVHERMLPEGYLAVFCERHEPMGQAWTDSPTGAPRGARLIAFHASGTELPAGARILRHVASSGDESRAVKVARRVGGGRT
jgi:hypothetical protein